MDHLIKDCFELKRATTLNDIKKKIQIRTKETNIFKKKLLFK